MISQLDVKPSQILIEAMIVEISSDYIRDIGLTGVPPRPEPHFWPYNLNRPCFSCCSNVSRGRTVSYLRQQHIPLNVTIKALEKAGKANILSTPRIMPWTITRPQLWSAKDTPS